MTEIVQAVEPWWKEIVIVIIAAIVRHFERGKLKRQIKNGASPESGQA